MRRAAEMAEHRHPAPMSPPAEKTTDAAAGPTVERPAAARPSARGRRPSDAQQRERWLGEQLREVYREVLDEPIPDDLAQLLRAMDESGAGGAGGGDRSG